MTRFETVAKLKLSRLTAGEIVSTKGYYSVGDGGDATYLIDAAQTVDGYGSHVLANGEVALLQVSSPVQAKTFGLYGDNSNNDTAALNAAIAYCDEIGNPTLYFSAGKYLIDSLALDSVRGLKLAGDFSKDEVASNAKVWFYWSGVGSSTDFFSIKSCAAMDIEDINFYSNGNSGKNSMLIFQCNDENTTLPRNKFASTNINFRNCVFLVASADSCTTATVHLKSVLGIAFENCSMLGERAIKLGSDTDLDPVTGLATIPDGRAVGTVFNKCTIRGNVVQERVLGADFHNCYIRENSVSYNGSDYRMSSFGVSGNEEVRNIRLDSCVTDAFAVTNSGISFYTGASSPPSTATPSLTANNNLIQGVANGFVLSSGIAEIKGNKFIGTNVSGTGSWNAITINSGVDNIDVQNNDYLGWLSLNTSSVIAKAIVDNRTNYEDKKYLLNRGLDNSFFLTNNSMTTVMSRSIVDIQGGFYHLSYSISILSAVDSTFTAGLAIGGTFVAGTRVRETTSTSSSKFTVISFNRTIELSDVVIGTTSDLQIRVQQNTGATYAEVKGDDYGLSSSSATLKLLN